MIPYGPDGFVKTPVNYYDPQVIRKTVQQLQQSASLLFLRFGFFVDRYAVASAALPSSQCVS